MPKFGLSQESSWWRRDLNNDYYGNTFIQGSGHLLPTMCLTSWWQAAHIISLSPCDLSKGGLLPQYPGRAGPTLPSPQPTPSTVE